MKPEGEAFKIEAEVGSRVAGLLVNGDPIQIYKHGQPVKGEALRKRREHGLTFADK